MLFVTLLGGSSGAVGIALLYLDPKISLFRSAIMSSGAPSTVPTGPTGPTWENSYQYLLNVTNCVMPEQTKNSFECLRLLPAQELLRAQLDLKANPLWSASFIFSPSVDGDLIPDSPHALVDAGLFARIPFITGSVKDEGTEFISPTVDGDSVLPIIGAIEPVLAREWPLPYDTGNDTFGLDPAYKQLSSLFGDVVFQGPRRHFLRQANIHRFTETWTFQFEQHSPDRPDYLGVSHATEVPYTLGEARPGVGSEHYGQFNYTDQDWQLWKQIMEYWINFAHFTNPNDPSLSSTSTLPYWPKHGVDTDHNMLKLKYGNVSVIQDTHRESAMNVLFKNADQLHWK